MNILFKPQYSKYWIMNVLQLIIFVPAASRFAFIEPTTTFFERIFIGTILVGTLGISIHSLLNTYKTIRFNDRITLERFLGLPPRQIAYADILDIRGNLIETINRPVYLGNLKNTEELLIILQKLARDGIVHSEEKFTQDLKIDTATRKVALEIIIFTVLFIVIDIFFFDQFRSLFPHFTGIDSLLLFVLGLFFITTILGSGLVSRFKR